LVTNATDEVPTTMAVIIFGDWLLAEEAYLVLTNRFLSAQGSVTTARYHVLPYS